MATVRAGFFLLFLLAGFVHANESIALQNRLSLLPMSQAKEAMEAIINGDALSSDDDFPFISAVLITINGGLSICTGSLIAPNAVMLAAHCVADFTGGSGDSIQACFGSQALRESRGECHLAERVVMHDQYNDNNIGNGYDIAVLHLRTTVDRPILSLELMQNFAALVETGTAVGFGMQEGGVSDFTLRKAELVLSSHQDCQALRVLNAQSFRFICAGGSQDGVLKGICKGDSGGPLIVSYGGKKYAVGVASFFVNSCEGGFESVYTRVYDVQIREFLQAQLPSDGQNFSDIIGFIDFDATNVSSTACANVDIAASNDILLSQEHLPPYKEGLDTTTTVWVDNVYAATARICIREEFSTRGLSEKVRVYYTSVSDIVAKIPETSASSILLQPQQGCTQITDSMLKRRSSGVFASVSYPPTSYEHKLQIKAPFSTSVSIRKTYATVCMYADRGSYFKTTSTTIKSTALLVHEESSIEMVSEILP